MFKKMYLKRMFHMSLWMGFMGVGSAWANGLQVAPTSVTISSAKPAGELWISHTSQTDFKKPMHAQIRVFAWSQDKGQDLLHPTKAMVVTPPLMTIEGTVPQLVRVLALPEALSQVQTEQAYRLIVDEIPDQHESSGGLSFVMHYSIPVFITPQTPAHPFDPATLVFTWVHKSGQNFLEVTNPTSFHAQLVHVQAQLGSTTETLSDGLMGYVLPEQTMRFQTSLSVAKQRQITHLTVRINGQEEHVSVGFEP